jgi:hypothetical protein
LTGATLVQTIDLASLGWTPELSDAFGSFAAQGLIPGRVGARHRSQRNDDTRAATKQQRRRDDVRRAKQRRDEQEGW